MWESLGYPLNNAGPPSHFSYIRRLYWYFYHSNYDVFPYKYMREAGASMIALQLPPSSQWQTNAWDPKFYELDEIMDLSYWQKHLIAHEVGHSLGLRHWQLIEGINIDARLMFPGYWPLWPGYALATDEKAIIITNCFNTLVTTTKTTN